MSLKTELESALQEIESDLGSEQVTLNLVGGDALNVPVVPNGVSDSTIVQIGPLAEQVSEVVFIRTGHFLTADNTEVTVDSDLFTADNSTARPRSGKTCTFRGRTMRIITTEEDGTRAYIKVFLGSAN